MIRNDQAIIAAMQAKPAILQTKNVMTESSPVPIAPEPQTDSILNKVTQLLLNFQSKDKTS